MLALSDVWFSYLFMMLSASISADLVAWLSSVKICASIIFSILTSNYLCCCLRLRLPIRPSSLFVFSVSVTSPDTSASLRVTPKYGCGRFLCLAHCYWSFLLLQQTIGYGHHLHFKFFDLSLEVAFLAYQIGS